MARGALGGFIKFFGTPKLEYQKTCYLAVESICLVSACPKDKRLACRVYGNALEKFAVIFDKNADFDWSESHE